jgi:hypothetical protein
VQTVGPKNELAKPARRRTASGTTPSSPTATAATTSRFPRHGAIWLTYYPATMVEWYPHVLVVSTLVPKGPQKTLNVVEFYYPRGHHAFESEFVEAEQACVLGDLREDDEIALRHGLPGRRASITARARNGLRAVPEHDGKTACRQFHEWYQKATTARCRRRRAALSEQLGRIAVLDEAVGQAEREHRNVDARLGQRLEHGAAGAAQDGSFFHRDDCIMAARQVSHQGDIERLGEAHVGDGRIDAFGRGERRDRARCRRRGSRSACRAAVARETSRRISPVPNGISVISAWTATPAPAPRG